MAVSLTAAAAALTLAAALLGRSDGRLLAACVSALVLLAVVLAVTAWTRRTLRTDLGELAGALERIVPGSGVEHVPRPTFAETSELAGDIESVAEQVRINYMELTSRREWLEAVLENINAGVIVLNRNLKIDMINAWAEKIFGTTRWYAVGRTFTEIHHTSVIDRAIEKSRRGASVTREVQISLPSRRTLHVLSNPIRDKEGGTTGVICVIEDVTARRKLERVRRDFVANVSHELRTPVTNMRAVVEALTAGASEDPGACARFMGDLDRESKRLADIIEDLLMLSRLETVASAVEGEPFEVEEMLKEALSEKEPLAALHEVSLVFAGGAGRTAVRGDRNVIRTAVGNLLDNAIKYNRRGGRVEVSVQAGEDGTVISVTDTGIGIPPGDLDKIFERFYRVDKARSRETGGTGLGLSIVKHAAEFHGGGVSVASREGEGSTFSLTLPG